MMPFTPYPSVTEHALAIAPPSLAGPTVVEQEMVLHGIAEAFGIARNWQRYARRHDISNEERLALKAMENLAAAYHGLLVAHELSVKVANPDHPCTMGAQNERP